MKIVAYSTEDDCDPRMKWIVYLDLGNCDYAPVRHAGHTKDIAITRALNYYQETLDAAAARESAKATRLAAMRKKTAA